MKDGEISNVAAPRVSIRKLRVTATMAEKIIVFWRDIPAQVVVQKGRKKERRELPERFMVAVDAAAMKVGAKDSDAYLAEWRRGEPIACGDDLVAEADNAVAEIDQRYDRETLKALVSEGGKDSS